jgi:PAS domain S-box-containing protein
MGADTRGTILSWNRSAQTMFGYTRAEIVGQPLTRLMPERHRAALARDLAQHAATEQPRITGRTEREGLRKDGSEFLIDLALSSWRTDDGLFFSAIIRDITERKGAERALRESEERFRELFEHAALGVYRTAPDGRILLANPALVRMLGYERFEELAARDLEESGFGPDTPRSRFKAGIEREGQVTGLQATWRRRDGSLIFVRESSKVIRDDEGRVRYYEGTVEDITERRSLEEQLRQSQKMDAIGRLAGGVAHDFNNLLTAILGYGALIGHALPEGDPARERADEIVKAATRAATLTRQLLTLSRGQVLEPTLLNLNVVVADMEEMLRRLIGEDLEVVTSFDPALGFVKADAGQMEQVVLNLAINARDAMPQGGRLTIETAGVQLDHTYTRAHVGVTPGAYVMLAVSDTGCGMDTEIQSHIFEPFFTTKEPGRGTGLGLATVYGIVKQSGGAIGVYSEVGRGSTFRIYLPRVAGGVEPGEPPPPSWELQRGTERILLVEDDAMVRNFTTSLLRESGYTVLEAGDPSDALALLAEGAPIDLVVTDIVMPRMSGPDLASRLAVSRPGMRVLFVSGYAGSHVTDGAVLPPGSAFLPKPFTPQALTRKVREVLDGIERHGARARVRPPHQTRPEAP